MFKEKTFVIFLILLALPIFSVGYFFNAIYYQCGASLDDKEFEISYGQGVNEISRNLKDNGIICDSLAFETYLWLLMSEGNIKAGLYNIGLPVSIKDLTKILLIGQKDGAERDIKIIEGWNTRDISEYLDNEDLVSRNDFLESVKNSDLKFSFLDTVPSSNDLEGFLFPDTYRIYNDASPEDIIGKMLDNFDDKLTEDMRAEIEKQNKTIFEIVTMASVVEKEVRSVKDMKVVSGIFWDRIKYGQPLESCATIGYVLGEDKVRYSYDDTRIDSTYNTYINSGLPSGPICNPGIQAIEAAIYPEFTEYNYFLSKQDGETVFSKTYEEHLINTQKYLK